MLAEPVALAVGSAGFALVEAYWPWFHEVLLGELADVLIDGCFLAATPCPESKPQHVEVEGHQAVGVPAIRTA
eukprot:5740862-Heterocapsa_arctica.AAC.2